MLRVRSGWSLFLGLAFAVAVAGCCGGSSEEKKPSRWETKTTPSAQPSGATTTAAKPPAPASSEPKPLEGSAFNKFFPADATDGTKRVFTQEKTGYAEAKFQKDGKDLITLSISDTANNPDARTKFSSATEKLQSHPMMTVGKNQSTILVKDRFQLKASSQTLDHEARKAWLSKFDLTGVAGL